MRSVGEAVLHRPTEDIRKRSRNRRRKKPSRRKEFRSIVERKAEDWKEELRAEFLAELVAGWRGGGGRGNQDKAFVGSKGRYMKWTAEADVVVGLAVGSGKRKLGVGVGIGRSKIVKNVGVDLGEHHLKRCCVFVLKDSTVLTLNWNVDKRNRIYFERHKAMKRSNMFNLLLHMMPSSHHQPVVPSSSPPDHWAFLEEVDAPQWTDLVKEDAMMGTQGDDPWFHRSHLHHETSLARAESLATVSGGKRSSVEIRKPQQMPRKGAEKGGGVAGGGKATVSKLIKPALKANVVKACLGVGLHRVSNGSSVRAGGRLSSRPRLSTSLSKSKPLRKVSIIHCPAVPLVQQQKFDPRAGQSEPSSTGGGTPKKASEGVAKANGNHVVFDPDKMRRLKLYRAGQSEPSSTGGGTPKKASEGVAKPNRNDVVFDPDKMRRLKLYRAGQSEPSSTGGGTPKKASEGVAKANGNHLGRSEPVLNNGREAAAQKVIGRRGGSSGRSNGSGHERDDASLRGFESRSATPVLYRLPTPLHHAVGQGVGDISQTDLVPVKSSPSDMNFSSDASRGHSISSQESVAGSPAWSGRGVRRRLLAEGRRSTTRRSNEALELLSNSRHFGEGTDVGVNEPHFEITSFQGDDGVETSSSTASTPGIDWTQQVPSRSAPPGRSPGPPIRVREIDKVGSSSAKKKTSSRGNGNTLNGVAATSPAEKGSGAQATHPILEKLRKSWGSALRVKQRYEEDPALSDTSTERDSGELKVQGNGVTTLEKWDNAQVQSEALKRAQQAGAAATATNHPRSTEREALIRGIITRERRAAITQHHQQLLQQQPPQPLQLITDAGVLDSPRSSFSQSNGSSVDHLPSSHKAKPSSTARAGLAKIQANYQRSMSDVPSKFKKQYHHGETGISKSLSIQANKANKLAEAETPPPPKGLSWKRKPAVPTRRQLSPRNIGPALNGVRTVPQASARATSAADGAPPHLPEVLARTTPAAASPRVLQASAQTNSTAAAAPPQVLQASARTTSAATAAPPRVLQASARTTSAVAAAPPRVLQASAQTTFAAPASPLRVPQASARTTSSAAASPLRMPQALARITSAATAAPLQVPQASARTTSAAPAAPLQVPQASARTASAAAAAPPQVPKAATRTTSAAAAAPPQVPQASSRTTSAATAPPHALARRSRHRATQSSPPVKRSDTIISNSGPLLTSTTKTRSPDSLGHSLDAGDASGPKTKPGTPDRKRMNSSVNLRGSSTSSVLKLTKQRSERTYSTTVKEALTNAAGARSCRNGVQVADESVAVASEDRKSKAAGKYEPRLHSVRAITEWDSKSGKRYYDLPQIERPKVNQEISAAAAPSKAGVRKRTSA